MGEGILYNFIFTKFPFKTVSGDVTAFRRINGFVIAETRHHPPPLDPSHVPSFSVTLRCELLAKFKHEMNNYSKEQAGRILLDKLPYILS